MRQALYLLSAVCFIFSSCSKEDDDNTPNNNIPVVIEGCTDSTALNFDPLANTLDNSCCYIEGCTDYTSLNYDPNACLDDGSCFASFYDIAQGIWNITPDCDEFTIPIIDSTISLNDQLPENIDVIGAGNNLLYIEIGETQVNGTIDNSGNITVSKQTVSLDMGFGSPMDIDVEGGGIIFTPNIGNMNLTYSFEIEIVPGFPGISEEVECAITLSR